jgi:acetamidase/formamidase
MTAVQRFTRDQTVMFLDPHTEPIGSVKAGETFEVETADSLCCLVKSEQDVFYGFDEIIAKLGGACPLTGPLYVDGAEAGECIAVSIDEIIAAPRTGSGWTTILPGWGALVHDMGYTLQDSLPPRTTLCTIHDHKIHMTIDGKAITIPSEPFLGTVAVAPRYERRMTLSQSSEYMGDVDLRALAAGTTLVLPVNIDGALISMGDAHAAQGEGEVTGVAVEVEADVSLSIRPLSREEAQFGSLPVLESEDWIGVIATFMGVSTADCVRAAYVDLCHRLERYHGFSRLGAYTLLGQVGRVQIGNMLDPFYSCLVTIDRRYLA